MILAGEVLCRGGLAAHGLRDPEAAGGRLGGVLIGHHHRVDEAEQAGDVLIAQIVALGGGVVGVVGVGVSVEVLLDACAHVAGVGDKEGHVVLAPPSLSPKP